MIFRKSPEKFWNLLSKKYAASPIDDLPAYEVKIQKLKTFLKPEYSVLDIGCGTGTQCLDLAGEVMMVTGIDLSSKLLAIAEQRKADRKIDNVEFIKSPLAQASFPDERFNVVMGFYVMHFQEDVEAVFKQIYKWLKPGGLLITESACLGENNKFMGKAVRFAGHFGFLPLINLLTYSQLEQALENAGFSLVEKSKFSKSSTGEYTLIASKQ